MTALATETRGYVVTSLGDPIEACALEDPELFFDADMDGAHPSTVDEAKATCARCFFKDKCLTDAIVNDERYGIRGGMTTKERRPYVKAHRAADRRRRRARARAAGQVETLPGV